MSHLEKKIVFFVTINKLTDEIIFQEGVLLSLKIPKQWQKPDSDVKSQALWVCHLPKNSLGIAHINLYPTELVIGKRMKDNPEDEISKYGHEENSQLICLYKGSLEPNGENDKEKFYRCQLELQENEKEKEKNSNWSKLVVFLIIIFAILLIFAVKNGNV